MCCVPSRWQRSPLLPRTRTCACGKDEHCWELCGRHSVHSKALAQGRADQQAGTRLRCAQLVVGTLLLLHQQLYEAVLLVRPRG